MPSNLDHEAACKRIAEAMGYNVVPDDSGRFFDGNGFPCSTPPNFFADPVAFMALWDWLRTEKRWEIGIHIEGRGLVDVYVADLDCTRCGTIGNVLDDNLMAALALTVDEALRKVQS